MTNKYLYFDDRIEKEATANLLESLSSLEDDQALFLYFQSIGGEPGAASVIVHALNEETYKREVFLYFPWMVQSAGFDVFLQTRDCKKHITNTTWAMVHESSREVDTQKVKQNDAQEMHLIKNLEAGNKVFYEDLKRFGIKQEHINRVILSEDVYLDSKDLEEILQTQVDKGLIKDYAFYT